MTSPGRSKRRWAAVGGVAAGFGLLIGAVAAAVAVLAVLPPAAVLLVAGVVFLAGFAAGSSIEQANLTLRERRLAAARRDHAADTRPGSDDT